MKHFDRTNESPDERRTCSGRDETEEQSGIIYPVTSSSKQKESLAYERQNEAKRELKESETNKHRLCFSPMVNSWQ